MHQKRVAELKRLVAKLESEARERLAELPGRFGFNDVDAFVEAVTAAVKSGATKRPGKSRRRKGTRTATKRRESLAVDPASKVARGAESQVPEAAGQEAAPVSLTEPEWPKGDSLEDPKNFGLRPDRAVLERGAQSFLAYREKLAEALRFATRVLHTSKVPAAVWREWRAFERELHAAFARTQTGS